MKYKMLFCLLFFYLQNYAQQTQYPFYRGSAVLIAANEKHTRKYKNGRALKIHYYSNGEVVKAKGRLLIDSSDAIELVPYSGKNITFINTDSIFSVRRWNRKDKITLAKIGGSGVVIGALGAAVYEGSSSFGVTDNILAFLLIITAVTEIYYVALVFPVVIAEEWLSVRSAKKGYHFSVE